MYSLACTGISVGEKEKKGETDGDGVQGTEMKMTTYDIVYV